MKKHELLVPAGNMDCLRQAVFNGCDAVYLACKNFGARKFAANFTNDEIIEAIRFCHLYGVRIYVTMNTLVKDNEVDDFLEQAFFLHQNGVDALIVQDFGMICLLRKMFPNLEIHASTQANISSKEICQLYYDLGVKRVVFARELTIDEIDSIDVPIEKEAFIHGALCISYSGCCLMSSMLGGRSGNRGECAGVCRMPFSLWSGDSLIKEEAYLLSTKELNTSSNITRLLNSSIDSFKIEGRMKGPLYVGFITNFYRRLLDGVEMDYSSELKKLKTIFNREFTLGRIFFATDQELMNSKSPNHIGLEIGKVINYSKKKIKIELFPGEELHQYDAIRFFSHNKGFIVNYLYDKDGRLVNSSDSVCYVDNKIGLDRLDKVHKTQDSYLEEEYSKEKRRKISISFLVKAYLGSPLEIQISDGNFIFKEIGDVVSKAIKAPILKENIFHHLNHLTDTPFECDSFEFLGDEDIFIPVGILKEMRRKLVGKLQMAREERKVPVIKNDVSFPSLSYDDSIPISCLVHTKEQLEACLSFPIPNIYVDQEELFFEYQDLDCIYYAVPRCTFQLSSSLKKRSFVSDFASFSNRSVVGNYPLNVTNIYTAYYLFQLGYSSLMISPELTIPERNQFLDLFHQKFGKGNFQLFGYGRIENMIIYGNILDLEENKNYSLKDSRNRQFPVYYDGRNTHILNWEVKDETESEKQDFVTFHFSFFDESFEEVKNLLEKYIGK